jgi:hypothetical protein
LVSINPDFLQESWCNVSDGAELKIAKTIPYIFAMAVLTAASSTFQAQATPAFAAKEKKACGYCHLRESGGGKRGFRGKYYDHNRNSFKGFSEAIEAAKAGVSVNAMGKKSAPTKKYP